MTEHEEGFLAYMFGDFLISNPYEFFTSEYKGWLDGWYCAQDTYPDVPRKGFFDGEET